ncbi:MAG: FAD-linked oxidase, partial [Acidobacteria bacterium]
MISGRDSEIREGSDLGAAVPKMASVADLPQALAAWRQALGPAHVLTDETALAVARTATFPTTQRVPAIIRPANRSEIQECMRIANASRTPVYPVSTGKNWGYGSRVPARDSCVIMDLSRLNRILDYDENLAYVRVETGVTFRQLFDFLTQKQSNLMMSVTGSTPDSSVVANALERGHGTGPYGDRFAHTCNLEVVLPTGECLTTGLGRFPDAAAASVSRWGVGPHLDGLFSQSNLGIVTSMTIWLSPKPGYLQVCFLGINDPCRLTELLDALRVLRSQELLRWPLHVWNDLKMLSLARQYPWKESGGRTPLSPQLRECIRDDYLWGSAWTGSVGLCAASKEQGQAERCAIERILGSKVDKLVFFDGVE